MNRSRWVAALAVLPSGRFKFFVKGGVADTGDQSLASFGIQFRF